MNQENVEFQKAVAIEVERQLKEKENNYTIETNVDFKDIKLNHNFIPPSTSKIASAYDYYKRNFCLSTPIVVNSENYVIQGYTTYLIAKMLYGTKQDISETVEIIKIQK